MNPFTFPWPPQSGQSIDRILGFPLKYVPSSTLTLPEPPHGWHRNAAGIANTSPVYPTERTRPIDGAKHVSLCTLIVLARHLRLMPLVATFKASLSDSGVYAASIAIVTRDKIRL